MYNQIVQQMLDEIYGYGTPNQAAPHRGPFSMLKQNVWDDAFGQASGGIIGRPSATTPSANGGGGGNSFGGNNIPVGAGPGDLGFGASSPQPGGPTGNKPYGAGARARRLDREGNLLPSANPPVSGGSSLVMPGGGFITYGVTPQKKQSYWWESKPWFQG